MNNNSPSHSARAVIICELCTFPPGKIRFFKSFSFKDINYQVSKQEDQEEVFAKYCEFLIFFNTTG